MLNRLALALFALVLTAVASAATAARPPNIVLILADDLGADPSETTDVSAANSAVVQRLLGRLADARRDLDDTLTNTPGANLRPAGDTRASVP